MALGFPTLEAVWLETPFMTRTVQVREHLQPENVFDFEHTMLLVPAGPPGGASRWLEICVCSSGERAEPATQI